VNDDDNEFSAKNWTGWRREPRFVNADRAAHVDAIVREAERLSRLTEVPCPTCKQPNRLTPADKARGYQCDQCADRDEGGGM
jgi:hypothetical protein